MRAVKISLSLLMLTAMAFSLCACNTLSNRRSLYSPKKGDGYWTRTLKDGSYKERGSKTADQTVKRGGASAESSAAPASAPAHVPPVNPSESLPETAQPAQ